MSACTIAAVLEKTSRDDLVGRYVALWNEPDPDTRRVTIRELWSSDGSHVLVNPPEAIRDAAKALDVPASALEVHGYEALEARVTRAYEMFLAPGNYVFKAGDTVSPLPGDVVVFTWEMVSTSAVAGAGTEVVGLDPDGRIRTDHQYVG